MKGGGTRYGRSYGAGSVENAGFARSKRGSKKMNGTRSNLPYALGVSMEQIRNGPPQERQEKCANGPLPPPIPERDDPEQPRGKKSRPGTQRLSLRRMRWRELNGASVCTGCGCLQHTLGMWDEATTRGGEVVYTIPEMRTLLHSQPEDTTRWLTTSQMGWALTREGNEIINERDEREGRQVARRLAPMISTFIRAQGESGELEDVDKKKLKNKFYYNWEGVKRYT
jgi:hypothetical protein